jgi:hypothetical protein
VEDFMSGTLSQSVSFPPLGGIQPTEAFGTGGLSNAQSEIKQFEAAIAELLQALEQQQGGQSQAGQPQGGQSGAPDGGGSSPADAAAPSPGASPSAGSPAAPSPVDDAAAPTSASPATSSPITSSPAGAPGTTPNAASGGSVAIDGGNASGHGVTEQVDNNTGSAARFGWENAQGQIVGELDLKNGQSGSFDVNADGPDATSARLIKLNPDGSIPAQSNLDEQNLAVNPNGSLQVSADVSEITAGSDPTQIQITDGAGKTVGNGAPGGAYLYPTEDQQSDPANNPMTMAMDTQAFYDNNFTN